MSTTITLLAMLDIRLRFVGGKCGLCVIVSDAKLNTKGHFPLTR